MSEGKTFTWQIAESRLASLADEDLLRRAFRLAGDRLLDETAPGGHVRSFSSGNGGTVRLRITAPPVAPDALPDGTTALTQLRISEAL